VTVENGTGKRKREFLNRGRTFDTLDKYFLLSDKAKKKYMCVYCRINFFFFFLLSAKPEIVVPESDSGMSFSKFPVK
jgi:hypothetical protein